MAFAPPDEDEIEKDVFTPPAPEDELVDMTAPDWSKVGTPFRKITTPGASDTTPLEAAEKGVNAVSEAAGGGVRTLANIPIAVYNTAGRMTGKFGPIAPYQKGESLVPRAITDNAQGFTEYMLRGVDPEHPEKAGPSTGFSRGLSSTLVKQVKGLTTPESVATLPLFELRAGRAAMLALMAVKDPAEIANTVSILKDPKATAEQKWDAGGDQFASLLMQAGIALHLGPSEVRSRYSPEDAAKAVEKAQVPGNVPRGTSETPTTEVSNAIKEGKVESGFSRELTGNDARGTPAQPSVGGGVPSAGGEAPATRAPSAPVRAKEAVEPLSQPEGFQPKDLTPEVLNDDIVKQPAPAGLNLETFTAKPPEGINERLKQATSGKTGGTVAAYWAAVNDVRTAKDPVAAVKQWGQVAKEMKEKSDAIRTQSESETDRDKKLELLQQSIIEGHPGALVKEGLEAVANAGERHGISRAAVNEAREQLGRLSREPKGKEAIPGEKEKGQETRILTPAEATAKVPTVPTTEPPEDVNEPKPASTVRTPAASVSSQQPIPAGPGAATAGTEIPETGAGGEKFGVAARVRAEREQAGQTAPTQPGEGIAARDSVVKGRELLAAGVDPEARMVEFEKTKRSNSEDMAVARAHGEALAKTARDAESKFGTDSDEYAKAWQRLSDWDARTKPMQTEWHKTGQAQQGETDLDTGSFTGLQRSFKDSTGEDFTPKQATQAKNIAKKVTTTTEASDAAKTKLFDQLKKQSPTNAEELALASAAKTVREAAAANAEAQRKLKVAEQARKTAVDKLNTAPDESALKAASKTVREAAVKKAQAERAQAVKDAERAKQLAQDEANRTQKILEGVQKSHRDAAAKAAAAERKRLDDPLFAVWEKVKGYIEQGMDNFDDVRNKVATDLGMKVDQVARLMAQDNRIKRASDDVWKKQQAARQMKERAKQWVTDQAVPGYQRALARIPRLLFSLKVGFHGTVALGTHAPMVAFQPTFWKTYAENFGKMYRMVSPVGGKAYYERQVQDLLRRPNYITARRAGLVNDPFQHEELRSQGILDKISPTTSDWINKISGMGNRGYSVLKMLRQDMFDQQWNQLPKTSQIPEVAAAIADGVNHATGVVKATPLKGANLALFAPKLEMSRAAWLIADPVKAADTFIRWKTASVGEKTFAVNQVKEKAWVLGTYFGLLALNQGILSATGSKQKVNMTDPMTGDFMKFKAAGMTGSYGNAMLTMARLPVRMLAIRQSSGGKLKNLIYPDEDVYTVLGEYARSQESPFASLATDLWFRSDWMRRQLPGSNRPMPARLRKQGVKPYTWKEFWTEQSLPIPAEEAVREVWQKGLGMTDEQIAARRKAWATLIIMSATGARLADDQDAKGMRYHEQ